MFSKRFYSICSKATNLGRKFGATLLYFDKNEQIFHNSEDPHLSRHFNLNYNLLLFWGIASFLLIPKYHIEGNAEKYNLTLFYWFMGLIAAANFSVLRWFSFDYCRWINGILILFRYFHSTIYYKKYNTYPNTIF